MNIVLFLHSFGIGGAERRCAMVANYFAEQGNNVITVLLDSPNILFEIDKRIKVFYLPNDGQVIPLNTKYYEIKNNYYSTLQKTSRESLRSDKYKYTNRMFDNIIKSYSDRIHDFVKKIPDYIVVSWVSLYSVACAIALKNLPNKFVFVECNAPDAEFDKEHYFNTLKQLHYPRANAGIFQTEDEKSFYGFLENTKKYVIPNPVTDLKISRYEGKRKKIIVNYCRLRKAKRLPLLIDAFEIFHKAFPKYQLHIYGEGADKNELVDYINSKCLTDSVFIYDFDRNIHAKIYDCAMYVSSSLFEGMSNSMLEAMSIGLPVVCTDCYGGGARAVIKDGVNGLLVPVEDAISLSTAMQRIADDNEFANKLSKNAALIKNILSKELICKSWHQAFNEISAQ